MEPVEIDKSKNKQNQKIVSLFLLASTIQFSNHQTPRTQAKTKKPQPVIQGLGPQPQTKKGVAIREPKSMPNILTQKTLTIVFHTSNHTQTERAQKLRRKEVIQPHLPVRLPCYDLVPITSLTLDGSIPKGLGHRLRVLPTFMT